MRTTLPLLAALLLTALPLPAAAPDTRQTVDLSGPGWKLWRDTDAPWKDNPVFLPPVDLAKLPAPPPTGGWSQLDTPAAIPVSVPGTAEEYLQTTPGPDGDITGVTWWTRSVKIPPAKTPRRLTLHFDAVRMRAEVFVNRKLVGYDLIGNTPFDVDLTNAASPGDTIALAVRITDPGGVFDWKDGALIPWGGKNVAGSHGFGGITGNVRLTATDTTAITDLWIRNTPDPTAIIAQATIENTTTADQTRDITLAIHKKTAPSSTPLLTAGQRHVTLKPGPNTVTFPATLPDAALWSIDHPNLHLCTLTLEDSGAPRDTATQTFGFRSFAAEGIGSNATFRLNHTRVFLRSAISWGFWPINGIYATPALAEKQTRAAKQLGLNMLNHHRCIGQPILFDKADELGLLMYEEPGDYSASTRDPFAQECIREKLRRMARRDRSHPSLVIYSLANEMRDVKPDMLADQERDMRELHTLDPDRLLTRTSGWAPLGAAEDQAKMNMRPGDDTIHRDGWYDFHHAAGPDVWLQSSYKNPTSYYNRTDNTREIIFWGEEGAISTPPRLDLIRRALTGARPRLGWDGQTYLDWHTAFDNFLTDKNLRAIYPTVDRLTTALGAISLEHQGRKIENARLDNTTDAYVINGWEAEVLENHSGIVDCFRNPKADPAILARYCRPLTLAIKPRLQIVPATGSALVDIYILNETNLAGPHRLTITVTDPAGKTTHTADIPVTIQGGDTFGQLIAEAHPVPTATPGLHTITARLSSPTNGSTPATGSDQILAVDWRSEPLPGNGAILEPGQTIKTFLRDQKNLPTPDYTPALPPLAWIIAARPPVGGGKTIIPVENLRDTTGDTPGLTTTIALGDTFDTPAVHRTDTTVNLVLPTGATPDPAIATTENYCVRWQGTLIPPHTGEYTFDIQHSGKATLRINNQDLPVDTLRAKGGAKATLQQGQPVPIQVELFHTRHNASCRLYWTTPDPDPIDPATILNRVEKDGTTLIILENAPDWIKLLETRAPVRLANTFTIGGAWLGGGQFTRPHPLFNGLPAGQAMSWPYQAVVANGGDRTGLEMTGETLLAGAWHSYPLHLGTTVGLIPLGRGRILFSTLNIHDQIPNPDTSADVARKLLCNAILWSAGKE